MGQRRKCLQKVSLIILASIILAGCCSPGFVVKKVEYKPPDIHWQFPAEIKYPMGDLVIVDIDTIYGTIRDQDTLYPVYEGVKTYEDGDTAVIAYFFPQWEQFEIKYFPDTIKFTDTIRIETSDIVFKGDETWEKFVWMAGMLVISGFIWYVKKKKQIAKTST